MMTGDYRYALVTCSPNTVETTNKAFRKGGFLTGLCCCREWQVQILIDRCMM